MLVGGKAMAGEVLCDLSMEELAGHVWKTRASPGHRFARKERKSEKALARNRLVGLLDRRREPADPIYCLTMPGLDWRFERQVLDMREHGDKARHTSFYCIESDEAVYRAALNKMPAMGDDEYLNRYEPPECATASYGNLTISKFIRCRFEDYIEVDYPPVDFIWADFNGPLSANRLKALATAWNERTRKYLAVTLMRGRTHESIAEHVREVGGIVDALNLVCQGSEVEHAIRYSDGCEMIQVCLRKVGT